MNEIRLPEMNLPQFARDFLRSEFFKYSVSGLIAFACDFSTLVILTEWLQVHYLLSNIAGYSVGLVVSYTINVNWVFKHRRYDETPHREFLYFTIIVIVGLAISEAVIFAITEFTPLHYTVSKVISVGCVFLFNYLVKKRLLFTPHDR
ncbi:MAG: GtrA family protein [Proteobacteria bacterium]|nr:GtrA family protein [Pseudomonadota bacterium]